LPAVSSSPVGRLCAAAIHQHSYQAQQFAVFGAMRATTQELADRDIRGFTAGSRVWLVLDANLLIHGSANKIPAVTVRTGIQFCRVWGHAIELLLGAENGNRLLLSVVQS